MLKSKVTITIVAIALVVGATSALVRLDKAFANASFSLNGVVPEINTVDVLWANENIALYATGGVTTVQNVIAALKFYSNDSAGYTVSVKGTRVLGTLLGTASGITIPYKAALFATFADATAGTPFLPKATASGTDSSYVVPTTVAGNVTYISGALTVPVDTGTGAHYLGVQVQSTDVDQLMGDSYTDTLTILVAGT